MKFRAGDAGRLCDEDQWLQLLARKEELVKRLKAIRTDLARRLTAYSEGQTHQLENVEVLREIRGLADEELRAIEREIAAPSAEV